ncbi:MAG: hypothetical protein A3K03_06590 [Bdellovibrionales bacterium RIFOXYD1_FULL_44_7]|nr:MAG: hypothetical protein A3K03_06590 [Bdellovibrionales bacterium RIFOXYD1_FULL_44_7]
MKGYLKLFLLLLSVVSISLSIIYRNDLHAFFTNETEQLPRSKITKTEIAVALAEQGEFHKFPTEVEVPIKEDKTKLIVQYTFDPQLQESVSDLIRLYGPDYGAMVVLDASTGRVLSMVSYSKHTDNKENLAVRATFPSASVFKLVTAAAAISERNFTANTVISFNGGNHTLYRRNVFGNNVTRWTRYMTLRDAFAHSVNTVFGKIGAYSVGAYDLREYASRFGFNRSINADIPIQESTANISDDPWSLAESASGYTKDTKMSPLQGALMAAAIVNNGVMMEPYVVQSAHLSDGTTVYRAEPRIATTSVTPDTASEIRELMRETIINGTSRGSFRGFYKGPFAFLNIGGKTGSLSGDSPPGKYDWFVGFAEGGSQKIAIAALSIHGKYWRVKSSFLARKTIEAYFKDKFHKTHIAAKPYGEASDNI